MARGARVVLGLVVLLVLEMACRPAATPSATQPQPQTPPSEWEQVLAAAKQEGVVAVSGPPQEAERNVILKFREAYPDIRLEYTGAISTDFFTNRLESERLAGMYLWDLVIGGIAAPTYKAANEGWLQPIKPTIILPDVRDDSKWLGGFDAGFADFKKSYVYTFTTYLSELVKVNRSVVPESELSSVAGLVDPKWRGKIVMFDPRAGAAGTVAMTALRHELGDEAIRKLLVDQQPVFSTDKRQFTEWVVRRRYPIGIGIADAYLAPFVEAGLGTDVKSLKAQFIPVTPGSGSVVFVDRAPHPNAAKVFLNWLLSQETQALWAKQATTNSRRLDVAPGSPETVLDPARLGSYVDFNSEQGIPAFTGMAELATQLVP